MFTSESLLEFHGRCHASFARILDHCATLTPEELHQKLPGFGDWTVQLHLHHAIGAERYWVGVLEGRLDIDEDDAKFPDAQSLRRFREDIGARCEHYLRGASPKELTEARPMTTWDGKQKMLVPAHVVIRTQTHLFHHQGLILAMCRALGKPAGGCDYPIESRTV